LIGSTTVDEYAASNVFTKIQTLIENIFVVGAVILPDLELSLRLNGFVIIFDELYHLYK